MQKRIAIVILNWNGAEMLRQYLPTVLKYSADMAEVVVADNASSDMSVELLRKEFPQVRLLLLDQNWGFAEGYNKALQQIDAEYYVLLNSDVEVTQGWLMPLLDYIDNNADVAACQPKLRAMARRGAFEYAGASGGFIDRYGYPFCRGRIFDTVEDDRGQYDEPCDVHWATGACLFIRSAEYWRCGGLDSRLFAHNEEIDLCWRLRIMGRRIVCLPSSVVYHVGGGTLPKGNPMKTFLNFRNNLTMLYKNLPDDALSHVMRMRWWLDYLAATKMLFLERNLGECKAVIRGRKAFKKWRADFAADRQAMQEMRKNTQDARKEHSLPERMPYAILWQYYVRGKKHYSDL